MKTKRWVILLTASLVGPFTQAGLFENSADLADLSEATPEGRNQLGETEFEAEWDRVARNPGWVEEA